MACSPQIPTKISIFADFAGFMELLDTAKSRLGEDCGVSVLGLTAVWHPGVAAPNLVMTILDGTLLFQVGTRRAIPGDSSMSQRRDKAFIRRYVTAISGETRQTRS